MSFHPHGENKVEIIRAEARSADKSPSSFIQSTNTTRLNFRWTQKTLRLFTFYHFHQRCTPISVGHELRQRRRAFHWRARPLQIFFFGWGGARAQEASYKMQHGAWGARGHVRESPGNTGWACPQRRVPEWVAPSNQRPDERWSFMLSLQWPVLNVGQGLDF